MSTRKIITLGDHIKQDAILEAQAIIRARRLELREEQKREQRLLVGLSTFGGEVRELALANTRKRIADLLASI